MPRKKKIIDKDKEKILDELAAGLKLNKEKDSEETEHEEESELEEDVDDSSLNLQALEFHQFMQLQDSAEAGAPVLERIAGGQPRPIFVGGMRMGTGTASGEESKDEFKYVPGAADANEPRYIPTQEAAGTPAERLDMAGLGRRQELFPRADQGAFFDRASESRGFSQQQTTERFERVERFDTERAGRRDPFERPEAKYEKYKPKLPKS